MFDFHHTEATGIKIKLRSSDCFFLIAVYRSPNCHVDCLGELEKLLDYDKEGPVKASHRVILGDYNLRQINWETETSNVNENQLDTKFLEAVRDIFVSACKAIYKNEGQPTRIDAGLNLNQRGKYD